MKLSITEFLMPFFPDENETLFLFGYDPKELPEQLKKSADRIQTSRAQIKTDKALQMRLKRINETRGLYFTVNSGGTLKSEINRINAVFCEIDDLPLAEQHDIFDNAHFPPSIRVETRKSVHAYWLLEHDITIDDFVFIQRGLIETFKSDKAIKNQNRVMRLPFFNHVSFDLGEYLFKPVTIHTFSHDTFTLDELKTAYSPTPEPEIVAHYKPANYDTQANDWDKVFAEVKARVQALPSYHVEHGGKLGSAQGVCHHGETNRTLVVNLQTGVVFCRNECTYQEIMQALGVEAPERKIKRFSIPRVPARTQTSELYQWITQQV